MSLGFDTSASVDSVKQRFVVAPNHEKHLIVCLILSDILCPIASDSPNALTLLMKRLMIASECVNMAIQVCQEWNFPGKQQIESLYDYVRQDNTSEAHKYALLFQVAELAQAAIMARLLSVRVNVTD